MHSIGSNRRWGGLLLAAAALLTTCSGGQAARRVRPLVVLPYLTRSGYLKGATRGTTSRNRFNRRAGVNPRRSNTGHTPALQRGKNTKFHRDVPVDLGTDLESLWRRHSSLVAKLPADLRRLDSPALAVVGRLPRVAQYSYLRTVEDYAQLTPDEQGRFGKVVKGLSDLGTREPQFVQAATPALAALEADKDRLHQAVLTPQATFFKLQEELDRLPAR